MALTKELAAKEAEAHHPMDGLSRSPEAYRMLAVSSEERKRMPVASGVMDYFPDAIAAVAEVSFLGNEKHNPGQPLHWERGKSMDHADCIGRHLIERGGFDGPVRHSAALAWRALALLQEELETEKGYSTPRSAWTTATAKSPQEALEAIGKPKIGQRFESGWEAVKPDVLGHRTRFSDSSLYDKKCKLCGGTDAAGDNSLKLPCPDAQRAARIPTSPETLRGE